jgi:hypothetical protein
MSRFVWFNCFNIPALTGIAQVLLAAVLVFVTARYTSITHKLLKAQVEPIVELDVESGRGELWIQNCGAYPVLSVVVTARMAFLENGEVHSQSVTGGPRPSLPNVEGWWSIKGLRPGESQMHRFDETVLYNATQWLTKDRQMALGDVKNRSVRVRFEARYQREVDRRTFSAYKEGSIVPSRGTSQSLGFVEDFVSLWDGA